MRSIVTESRRPIHTPGKAYPELETDAYVRDLVALERNGLLSKNELSYRIQEDFFWRDRFEAWRILGVEKLKTVNGAATDEALTLKDIRAEIRAEMGSLSRR